MELHCADRAFEIRFHSLGEEGKICSPGTADTERIRETYATTYVRETNFMRPLCALTTQRGKSVPTHVFFSFFIHVYII